MALNDSPIPSAASVSPKPNGSSVISVDGKRILCTADVRGNLSQLNKLAHEANADFIIHTGDFGFFEQSSLERISDRALRHLVQFSTLIPTKIRSRLQTAPIEQVRQAMKPQSFLSEFPEYLLGDKKFDVPVYTVWGACEDITVLEKLRTGEYQIPNLFILDEATTYVLDIGGVSLRLFGLGGAVVQHKLFDNGEGTDTIAGGSGTMWTTVLQIGELVETAQNVYDPRETRVLVTHASPGREGLLAQLALVLRADFTISAGLHFRYAISYNEFACQPDQEHYRERLLQSQASFMQLWESIKDQVENYVDDRQAVLLRHAMTVVARIPGSVHSPSSPPSGAATTPSDCEEQAFKNMWNFNLPDAAFGWLVLDINQGRVSAETKSQGFNFSFRRNSPQSSVAQPGTSPALSAGGNTPPSNGNSPGDKHRQSVDWKPQQFPPSGGSIDGETGTTKEKATTSSSYRHSRRQSSLQRNPYAVFVGGLTNNNVSEDDIKEFFGRENVTDVRFPRDPVTQLPKSHCYVDFIDPIALENALSKNGQVLQDNTLVISRPHSPDGRGRGRNARGRSFRAARSQEANRAARENSTEA